MKDSTNFRNNVAWFVYEFPLLLLKPAYLLYFRFNGFPWRNNWKIYGRPIISMAKGSTVQIGERLTLRSTVSRNSIGVAQPVILRTLNQDSELIIGNNVGISGSSIVVAEKISIGDDVLIGSGVLMIDNDLHDSNYINRKNGIDEVHSRPVIIGNGVFIGARAIILKGVTIGVGAVVGAGAVVSQNVPPYSIVVGNPATVVKYVHQ